MRASRLLSILMLLQTRGRMSAQALADAVEVSVRTVYRDIDHLSAAGVPVWAERGSAGGFQLQDGWRTRLTGLTEPEAQALFLAGLPGPAAELGLGSAMASAQLKVLATLPADWQADVQRVSSRFHLDPVDWFRSAASTEHLPAVAHAVWDERRLAMRYERWNGMVDREVEPLGLVLKAGVWYMAARAANDDGEPHTYRLSNIRALSVLDERFARPKSFDLAAYWQQSTRRFEAGLYRDQAVVRVSPRGRKLLAGAGPAVAEALSNAPATPDDNGWSRMTIPIESIDQAARQLLALGADVEVLEPSALRERMAQTLQAMQALYVTTKT